MTDGLPFFARQGGALAMGVAAIYGLDWTGFVPLVSIGGGVAAYAAGFLVLPARQEASEIVVAPGMTAEALEAILDKARGHVRALRAVGDHTKGVPGIKASAEGALVGRIADVADDVLAQIQRNPARLNVAQMFLDEHLPRVVAVAREQDRLRSLPREVRDRAALDTARSALEAAERGFGLLFSGLTESDTRTLTDQSEALTRLLTTEFGYGVKPAASQKDIVR